MGWPRQRRPRWRRYRAGCDRRRLCAAAAPLRRSAELRHLRSRPGPELTEEEKRQRQAADRPDPLQESLSALARGRAVAARICAHSTRGTHRAAATLRLGVEPALRDLFIRVTKLPLIKRGPTALKPFGYDLFDHPISTFAPPTNVPVPAGYVMGPGDELEMQLYGNRNASLKLIVGRDGRVNVAGTRAGHVGGETFESAKAQLESRVERQMVGVHASVTMGETRTIRVFVLGDAKSPGSYTISGLGTITSALFAAGGVQPIGSLRNIQLKRHGGLVRRLDLYDMLIRGDTTDDARLLPDDVIFIPPIGPTVTVDGEVHRPAIYEIRNENSIADVVAARRRPYTRSRHRETRAHPHRRQSASGRAAGRSEWAGRPGRAGAQRRQPARSAAASDARCRHPGAGLRLYLRGIRVSPRHAPHGRASARWTI